MESDTVIIFGRQHPLAMFILDVLRHDTEPISSIVKMLNNEGCIGWREFWPHDFTIEEVTAAIGELAQHGLVSVLEYDARRKGLVLVEASDERIRNGQSDFWFAITPAGRDVWDAWDPPTGTVPAVEAPPDVR